MPILPIPILVSAHPYTLPLVNTMKGKKSLGHNSEFLSLDGTNLNGHCILQKGQLIQIISKNDTGMWRGVCGNKIGTFKFINVEVISDESPRVTPSRQRRQRFGRRQRARTVQELLEKLELMVKYLVDHPYSCFMSLPNNMD